ncbi:hypothetical protein NPIL_654261 [Nephila pilipes]|uniref:Uncharacterized protein n=1 Tax=Nephila pilipes TaxID=299642 RepID=A0A8X6NEJ0_NEPPI|nr:hypothetical protein NPIL_654261 [Nephila pilipes]
MGNLPLLPVCVCPNTTEASPNKTTSFSHSLTKTKAVAIRSIASKTSPIHLTSLVDIASHKKGYEPEEHDDISGSPFKSRVCAPMGGVGRGDWEGGRHHLPDQRSPHKSKLSHRILSYGP